MCLVVYEALPAIINAILPCTVNVCIEGRRNPLVGCRMKAETLKISALLLQPHEGFPLFA